MLKQRKKNGIDFGIKFCGGGFEMFRSKWIGLWKNNSSEYAHSSIIDKSVFDVVPEKFRIVLKRNKQHAKGDNRPNFVFSFADTDNISFSNEYTSFDITHASIEDIACNLSQEGLIKVEDAVEVAKSLLRNFEYGYSIEDLVVEVDEFMRSKQLNEDDLLNLFYK